MRPSTLCLFLTFGLSLVVPLPAPAQADPAPVVNLVTLTDPKAIAGAQKYRDVLYRLKPELASREGVTRYDGKIADVSLNGDRSRHKELANALKKLEQAADKESDPAAQKELKLYIESQQAQLARDDQAVSHDVQWVSAAQYIADGLKPVMDPAAPNSRHIAGGERMKRYVGIDPDPSGNSKLTENASISRSTAPMTGVSQGTATDSSLVTALIDRMTVQMKQPDAVYPRRAEVIDALEHTNEVVNGMLASFRNDRMSNWETAFAALQREVLFYDQWVKTNILPHTK